MSSADYFFDGQDTYAKRKAKLTAASREHLEAALVNQFYNGFMRDWCDVGDGETDTEYGKHIPYIGWFWRDVDFSDLSRIPIGNCGSFVGFMKNNKWDYPGRLLTLEEANTIIDIIDDAILLSKKGGSFASIRTGVIGALGRLWAYMQTLRVEK